jgi:hypothetical protein
MDEKQKKAVSAAIERANERARTEPGFARRAFVEQGIITETGEPGPRYRDRP